MKTLSLLPVLLIGCLQEQPIKTPQKTIQGPIVLGHSGGIDWKCQQMEVDQYTVWIECNFSNSTNAVQTSCIRVAYDLVPNVLEVVHSRNVCSGLLPHNQTFTNYAAFINKERAKLSRVCGMELEKCQMVVR